MRKWSDNVLPLITITILGLIFLFVVYGNILRKPNNYIFSNHGDGIKNYYTYAYHIKQDSTFTNFEGMNYPYGENYLYTDCHPILANTFQFLSSRIPFFETHSIGILNVLMLLSIFITFIIIYLLLVELKMNRWFSLLFSISITLLAPQLFRIEGHFALSYSIAIPLAWLLTLKYLKEPRGKYLILLFLNNLFWLSIHAYLGVIVVSFIISIFLIQLFHKQRLKFIPSTLLAFAIILPIGLFYAYTMNIETHIGRTNNPAGFFLYNAELDDLLISHEKPLRPILDKLTGNRINLKWEAWSYLGFFNSLLFIAITLAILTSRFYSKSKDFLRSIFDNRLLNISVLAATIVLLFAMGMPFVPFPSLLEAVPILKQFRATGRFAWPFYFAFTAFAAHVFQTKYSSFIKNKYLGILFLILILGFSYLEGFQYHKDISHRIVKAPNLFNKESLPKALKDALVHINPNDYQAIIAFPFYYQGSESFARPRTGEAVQKSLVLSYHTGLPNICANLTRTSIEESKRIVQIVTPNYYPKKIEHDFPNKKPFLILKTGNTFTKYEQAIIQKSQSFYQNDQLELLSISFDELFSDDRNNVISKFQEARPTLIEQREFLVNKPSSFLRFYSFENNPSDIVYSKLGSFSGVKKGKSIFAEFPPNSFQRGKEYDLSLWMFNGEPDALNLWFRVIIEEYNEVRGKTYTTTIFPDQAEVINGNWSLVEGVFSIRNPKNKVSIISIGKENSKASLHVDDLLIKEKGVDVYKLDSLDHVLFFNNHSLITN